MPKVMIPSMLSKFTDGKNAIDVEGNRIDRVIENLETQYPGIRQYLCDGNRIRVELHVSVDNKIASLGMYEPVKEESTIHFIPAVGGG